MQHRWGWISVRAWRSQEIEWLLLSCNWNWIKLLANESISKYLIRNRKTQPAIPGYYLPYTGHNTDGKTKVEQGNTNTLNDKQRRNKTPSDFNCLWRIVEVIQDQFQNYRLKNDRKFKRKVFIHEQFVLKFL